MKFVTFLSKISIFITIFLKYILTNEVSKLNFRTHRRLKRRVLQNDDTPANSNSSDNSSNPVDSDKTCALQSLKLPPYKTFVSFKDFFNSLKGRKTGFTSFEIKEIFRFIDIKNTGAFTMERWADFNNLFLSSFNECDADKNCILDKNELNTCLSKNETTVVLDFPDVFQPSEIVDSIIYSLDYNNVGGLNLNQYLLLRKIIIGFRQHHVNGKLDKEMFNYAMKITFNDKVIDEIDVELAFKTAIFLMKEKIIDFQLNFLQYLEICRIIHSFFSFDVSISEGWITKQEIYNGYEYSRFPSKVYKTMFDGYFSLFDEDSTIKTNDRDNNYDPLSMQFETFAFVEFWGNIFGNYSVNFRMNITGFSEITKNQYFPSSFIKYLNTTNFEDTSSWNLTLFKNNFNQINDKDFLLSFIEKNIKSGFLKKVESSAENKKKTANKFKYKSLFELSLDDNPSDSSSSDGNTDSNPVSNSDNSTEKLNTSMKNIFNLFDVYDAGFITFENYFIFYKYLRAFDILNNGNDIKNSVISSKKLSDVNQIIVIPPLTSSEKIRLAALDSMNCDYVDFLFFFDYLIAPRSFKPYLIDNERNFVNEINLKIILRKMNLNSKFDPNNLVYTTGMMLSNYDYENVLKSGLENKCKSNEMLYAKMQDSNNGSNKNDSDGSGGDNNSSVSGSGSDQSSGGNDSSGAGPEQTKTGSDSS